MTQQSKYDTSLAFVDVITNGLGGMLILFFIVVLLQARLEWSDADDGSESRAMPAMEPFVMVVTAKDGTSPFDPQATESLWKFGGVPPGVIAERRGEQWDWGASYAIFVSNRPLKLNSTVSLRTGGTATPFTVEVYPAGAEKKTYEVASQAGNMWTEMWPAVGER